MCWEGLSFRFQSNEAISSLRSATDVLSRVPACGRDVENVRGFCIVILNTGEKTVLSEAEIEASNVHHGSRSP
jgi:hypothetical protein